MVITPRTPAQQLCSSLCPNGLLAQKHVQRQLRFQAKLVLLVVGHVQSVWSIQSTICELTS